MIEIHRLTNRFGPVPGWRMVRPGQVTGFLGRTARQAETGPMATSQKVTLPNRP